MNELNNKTPNPFEKKGSVKCPNEYRKDKKTNKLQANGKSPEVDNPVPSLDDVKKELFKKKRWYDNYQDAEQGIKECYNFLTNQNGRETDKEQPKFTEEEYNLICRGLNQLGVTSGRVFYVLNRSVMG